MVRSFSEEYELIYSNKTKVYFSEVISSYDNKNYRSAIVMLYSLVICDLLFKLQELTDTHEDKVAKGILEEINKMRNPNDNKLRSKWERELVDSIHEKTELLDDSTYINILHLYDHRNLCAHPALNDDYELHTPNQETVASHIRNVLDGVFIKPPIYIKNVVETLVTDIAAKQDLYKDNRDELHKYLMNRYFLRMSDKRMVGVFKVIWKFVFVLDNEDCRKNVLINRKCLQCMLDYKPDLLIDEIAKEPIYSQIDITDEFRYACIVSLCMFTSGLYKKLSTDLQFQIKQNANKTKNNYIPIMWFVYDTFSEYYNKLITPESVKKKMHPVYKHVFKYFTDNARIHELIDYLIMHFSCSGSFDTANSRFEDYIKPHLSQFTREQAEKLIAAINDNFQIYSRGKNYIDNTFIVSKVKDVLGLEYDYTQYTNFKFDRSVINDTNDDTTIFEIEDSEDDDLPF